MNTTKSALKGLSFLICIGKPAWPKVEITSLFIRVVLGPIAFWIMFDDFENWLARIQVALKHVNPK